MAIVRYILWWELGRLLFNALVLGASLVLCFAFGFDPFRSDPGSGESLLFITYLLFIVLANLVYTLIYGVYYKKAKESKPRIVLFKRMVLYALILLISYTIFILLVLSGLFR